MTEHEKLKEICDKIGYKNLYQTISKDTKIPKCSLCLDNEDSEEGEDKLGWYYNKCGDGWDDSYVDYIKDVREIIFTKDFKNKLEEYGLNNKMMYKEIFRDQILDNLDNPVQYLYNLLEN